jgi:coenzyme F420 biosynthesis associated uncharacterized protein
MQQIPAVDWDAAVTAGAMVLPAGPQLSPDEIDELVADLRRAADEATEHAVAVTQLATAAEAKVLVVDRASWLKACTQSASALLGGVGGEAPLAETTWERARAKALGGQAGVVFAAIATRILGQFDPFYEPNRLLLVAPNVVGVERELAANPRDFRLWVCLHEQTHRLQFGQAPWLREHLIGLIGELLDGDELKYGWRTADDSGRRSIIGSPEQRAAFDSATAVMSLLEGYADVMMDRVGSEVVPTYAEIRAAFERRRSGGGWFSWVQKLFGFDLKYAQYREGAAFCRAVIEAADVPTLNQAFSAPGMLPSLGELDDPQRWLHRL